MFILFYKSIYLQLGLKKLVVYDKYFEKHFSGWLHPFNVITSQYHGHLDWLRQFLNFRIKLNWIHFIHFVSSNIPSW